MIDKFKQLMTAENIVKVDLKFLEDLVDSCDKNYKYQPLGKYYAKATETEDGYVACDNSTGDAFTEYFTLEERCILWLANESLSVTQTNFKVIPTVDLTGKIIEVSSWKNIYSN